MGWYHVHQGDQRPIEDRIVLGGEHHAEFLADRHEIESVFPVVLQSNLGGLGEPFVKRTPLLLVEELPALVDRCHDFRALRRVEAVHVLLKTCCGFVYEFHAHHLRSEQVSVPFYALPATAGTAFLDFTPEIASPFSVSAFGPSVTIV